jgi:hypothetical protein
VWKTPGHEKLYLGLPDGVGNVGVRLRSSTPGDEGFQFILGG